MFEETSGANSNPSSLIAVFLSHLRGQYRDRRGQRYVLIVVFEEVATKEFVMAASAYSSRLYSIQDE